MRITKRLGALAIALVLVLSMLPASAFAADWGYVGKIGNGFEWNYDYTTGVLTISNYKGGGPMVDCGKLVDSIDSVLHAKNVVIEEGITSVGAGFFDGCYFMESVTLPSTITQIGAYAFNGCSALKEITIPDGVTYIPSSTFYSCKALTSVVVPEGVTELGKFAFANCSKLTEISLPSTLVKIDNAAFEGCSSLPTIEFPASVTEVGRAAFNGCTALTELKVPDTMTEIGDNFLDGCKNLTEFEIPAGVTRIGNYAFRNCSGLTELVIPEGVTQIGDSAFEGCTGLREVVLPDSVETIGKTAFKKNTKLTSMELPANLKTLGEEAFIDCTALKSVTLPEGLKSIDKYAFQRCPLESIVIPSTVTSLGTGVFSGCEQLKNVQLLAGVSELSTGMFNSCPIEEIVIPDGVVTIWNDTFYGCKNLKTVTIPESVTMIHYQAFRNAATDLTIRCYEGSVAETWAQNNGYTIEYLKDDIQSVEIIQMPDRTQFAVGETLDLSGMKLKLTMGDGTTKIVNTGYTLEQKTMEAGGPMWVTVNYRQVSTRLLVTPSTNEGRYFSVSFPRPCVYTPNGCSPSPVVTVDGKEVYVYGDFYLSYSNNKTAGQLGLMTITGRGKYEGIEEHFNYMILPGNIADCEVSCGTPYYTGQPVRPITVKDGSTMLKEGVDYRVEYSGNVELGKASYVIIGIGNYTGSRSGNFTIQKKPEVTSKTVSLPTSSTSVVTGLRLRFEIEAMVRSYEIYTSTGAYVTSGSANPSASSSKASFGYTFSEPGSYTLEYKYCGYRPIYQTNGTVRYEPTGTVKTGTVSITVTQAGSSSETEELPNATGLSAGEIAELDARTRMLYLVVTPENTNPGVITWTSSDPDVATVTGGRVYFVKPGEVVVTAESSLGMQVTFTVSAESIDLTDGGRIIGHSEDYIDPWSVYHGNTALKEGVDFTATKTEEDGLLTYQVTGIGMYTGTITKQINANKSELPCVHELKTQTVEATCASEGYTLDVCHCGYSIVTGYLPKPEHTWNEGEVTAEPTEEAEGVKLYTCTVCGGTKEEVLPKIEHVHNHIPEVTPATCVTDGYTTYTCACGDSYQADVVPALGHDYDLWQIDTEPAGGYGIGTMHRDCANGHTEYAEYDFTLTDVPNGKYFSKPVYWAFVNGITKGKTTTEFQRDVSCTRKQIVTFLWRAAGQPEPKSMVNPFTDVKRGDQFEKAILWAYYEGITSGTGDGTTFSPDNACTRKQIVTFLWRFYGEPAPASTKIDFTDVKNDRFAPAILWAAEQGITTGTGDGSTFSPENTCTRGQIVTFLYRAMTE